MAAIYAKMRLMRWKRPLIVGIGATVLVLGLIGWFIKDELFYDPTVWSQDLPSPDGAWIANATTRQWGGFGSAWVETTISVRTTGTKFIVDKNKPFDVFSYPGGMINKSYTLDASNKDSDLTVRWLSPKRLDIGHSSAVDPDLVVIRRTDVDISYEPGSFAGTTLALGN